MQRQLLLFSVLYSLSAFAVLPTINCTDRDRGVVFEEGIDDFLFDIRDVSSPGTIPGALTPRIDGAKYLVQLRLPKRAGAHFSAGRPTCVFGELQPMLMNCLGVQPTEKLKLTNVATGAVSEITVNYLGLTSSIIKTETLDNQANVQTANALRFSLQMSYIPLPPPAAATSSATATPGAPADPTSILPVARPAPTPGVSPAPFAPVSRPGYLRADFDVRQDICKTGDQAESPAR